MPKKASKIFSARGRLMKLASGFVAILGSYWLYMHKLILIAAGAVKMLYFLSSLSIFQDRFPVKQNSVFLAGDQFIKLPKNKKALAFFFYYIK